MIKKPIIFHIIGWSWILFSILSLFDTIIDVHKIIKNQDTIQSLLNNPPPEMKNVIDLVSGIYSYWGIIMVFKLLIAIAGFVIAINFLRLRQWSLKFMEIITWIYVFVILSVIIFAFKFNAVLATDGRNWQSFEFAIIALSIFLVPFLLIAWQLRNVKIRNLFKNEG
ncbi:MAG: hypothetical protein ACFFCW_29640 [Candidatus Hodarchaeota archaeon]